MAKSFSLLLFITSLFTGVILFTVLNIKLALYNGENLKQIAEKSSVYEIASSYIRDMVIKDSEIKINEGDNFEKINVLINPIAIKETVNNTIDQLGKILANPQSSDQTFNVSYSGKVDDMQLDFQKTVNLENNQILLYLTMINTVILSLFGAFLVQILLAFYLFDDKFSSRFKFIGAFFITLSLVVSAILITVKFEGLKYIPELIKQTGFLQEEKLVNGLVKFVTNIILSFGSFYTIELIISFALGVVLVFVGKILTKDKVEGIEGKL